MAQEITKDMIITEVLEGRDYLVPIFYQNGLFSLGCVMAHNETLEEASFVHGINCDQLVHDLNQTIAAVNSQDQA